MCKKCSDPKDMNPMNLLCMFTALAGFFKRRAVKKRIAEKRPGRNEKCPCGCGHKFKKCLGKYKANA